MRLYESIETNVLENDIAKMIKEKYNIEPKIDCAPSRMSKYAVERGLSNLVSSGIEFFQSIELNVDEVSIGYPGSGDNGVWNNEYGITFTDDAMGETFDGYLVRFEIKDKDTLYYIGEHLFKDDNIMSKKDNNGRLFTQTDDGEWLIEGYVDEDIYLYYIGRHRKEAVDRMKRFKIK